ncbi:unnamed protein product (macronuclear) [Paramecium tetraurelia]|uniref:Serine/threonine-protein phosphatase 4 regulatory subunit 3-like central domain-containing protein n=1 Tax=Paramecium tetraurelia TaxID=5888 RepID=A0CZS2_PARTE|nr:uncharacterized protein GSPATT00011862001 [Paramecium tetraurelia]CAK76289.1 unnamed protein product [Paramecium tetraurelia]|eukprot:XP_001443686.1 hypothetical protein (macronuclear) [Paramecium tetraurelia strain d4-2]
MDTLLKQDNLTLEAILNEEDILSELKNQSSSKFADFIVQHPNEYSKMIYYITNDVTDREQDRNTCIKYPFLISEVLGSENEKLINFLFEKQGDISQEEIQNPLEDQPTESQPQEFQNDNENLRQKLLPDLLSILEHDSLLITSAGYFTKIISAIIHKRGYDFWEYLKSNPEIISNLFKHANIRHITEIFEKLIILDTCQEEHDERLFIQERQLLIARLLKYLKGQSHQNSIITNICESLIEVYKRALMSLDTMEVLREILLTIEKPAFFMSLAFDTQNSSLYNLLNVQYEFYTKMSQLEEKHYDIQFSTLYSPVIDESIKALIQQDILRASFQTTYGATVKPLGDSKLSLIQLIVQLIQKQELAIIFQQGQIFQQVINLVLDYSTNNQLHILFEKMIVAIINSKQPHLHELLFQTNFLNFLIINNGLEERKKKHGYQGILTKITNYINSPNVLEQYLVVQTAIANIQNDWQKYIEELKVVNQIEQAWLLGINPKFREQVNVDSFSPPLLWPEPLGSGQYQTTNNQTAETSENSETQQDSQEENSNHNQYQDSNEYNQPADQFDSEEAQIDNEKEAPLEVVQVREENLEQLEEQQIQKHEQQILDSPVYVTDVQLQFQYENIPEQTKEVSEQQPNLIQEEQPQEMAQHKEESNQEQQQQSKDQIQEEQNLHQEQQKQEEQQPQKDEQLPMLEEQQPKQEEQQPKQEELQPQQDEQQPQQEKQLPQKDEQLPQKDDLQPQKDEQQPQEEKQLPQQDEQKLQVEQQLPQTEDHENKEQIEQPKQPQEEA